MNLRSHGALIDGSTQRIGMQGRAYTVSECTEPVPCTPWVEPFVELQRLKVSRYR